MTIGEYNGLEVVNIEGHPVALDGWNGEQYTRAFKVSDRVGNRFYEAGEDCQVRPVQEQDGEDYTTIGYEFCY